MSREELKEELLSLLKENLTIEVDCNYSDGYFVKVDIYFDGEYIYDDCTNLPFN